MEPKTLLLLMLIFISINFFIGIVLDVLNLRYKRPVPERLKAAFSEDKLQKARAYFETRTRFGFISGSFSFLVQVVILLTGLFGWFDGWLRQTTGLEGTWLSLLYLGALFLLNDIVTTPFSYYSTFVIEEKFGFNKMKPGTFFADKLKSWILGIIIGGGLMWLFFILVDALERDFWWLFWIIASLFMIGINFFYTSWIVPLFNKLVPLEPGTLKEKILSYADQAGFPLTNIYVIDGSKRSSKSNAFFSGFGSKKKVVLYDTLIEQQTEDELVAVLAHEVGHYKKKHILTNMITGILQVGVVLFLLSRVILNEDFSFALGGDVNAIHLNLIAFGLLFSPLSTITGIVMNIFSRKHEFEADRFAAETFRGEALEEALIKLSAANLTNLTPHPAYVFVHYSHPPLDSRLKALSFYRPTA